MAIVKIKFVRHAEQLVRYVADARSPTDPWDAFNCTLQNAAADFDAVRRAYGGQGAVNALHIVQSWSEEESKLLPQKEFNAMGRELAEQKFPGHAFLVVTHTDTGKIHNHIVVCPWHSETGKKVENKKRHLYELRDINDRIAKERGLGVPERSAKERQAKLPDKVWKMARFDGKSWLIDMCQKADFARAYATSYDEYKGILGELGVHARIEEKNISYFYGDTRRAKRGSKLGRMYDKPGLEEAFKRNDEVFAKHPGLKERVRGVVLNTAPTQGDDFQSKVTQLSRLSSETYMPGVKDYTRYTKEARPGRPQRYSHELDLSHSPVPIDVMRRARTADIHSYCRQNRIELLQRHDGKHVLKGREFVEVDRWEWVNTRNRTKGSLIEFVAAHKGMTYLQSIAEITGNKNLLLLERHLGTTKHSYVSFHVPVEKRMEHQKAVQHLSRLLTAKGADHSGAASLLKSGQAQVTHDGVIRLFPQDDHSGVLECREDASGKWRTRTNGKSTKPFFASRASNRTARIYLDPFSFLKHEAKAFGRGSHCGSDILCLMEPNSTVVDAFLAGNRHISHLEIFHKGGLETDHFHKQFMDNLRSRYAPFGISISELKSLGRDRSREMDLPGF